MIDFAPRIQQCLAVVVQHAAGQCQPTENLRHIGAGAGGPAAAVDPAMQLAVYSYLGDMGLRFVFKAPGHTDLPVRLQDMEKLGLTAEQALALAKGAFKRSNGAPLTGEFVPGVYMLRGADADTYANYFLDRGFWYDQLQLFPDGVLVAVPKRGSLFFANAADEAAVAELSKIAARFFEVAGKVAISGCMYQFGADGWKLHSQLRVAARPIPAVKAISSVTAVSAAAPMELTLVPVAAPASPPSQTLQAATTASATGSRRAAKPSVPLPDEEQQREDTEALHMLAASGQRVVIRSIVANFFINGLERSQALPDLALILLSLAVMVYGLVGVVRICSGLNRVQGEKIFFMVMAFAPLLNIVALVYLSMKTSRMLREAGWQVGLLGAKP